MALEVALMAGPGTRFAKPWPRLPRWFGAFGSAAAALVLLAACTVPPPSPRPPYVQSFVTAGEPFSAPALVPFAWHVTDANRDELTCRIDLDGDGTWDRAFDPCDYSGSRNFTAPAGDFTAVFEVSDPAHPPVTATSDYSVSPGPAEAYEIETILTTDPDPDVLAAIADAVALWEDVIARGVPDTPVYRGAGTCGHESPEVDTVIDDMLVVIAVVPVAGYAGLASKCEHGADLLPRLSWVHLAENRVDWYIERGLLDELVAHELGHAIGFTGLNWFDFVVDGQSDDPRFSGPRSVAAWSELGGEGLVPLEARQGGGHWREKTFRTELMTCYLENVDYHPLSALTVASMADIGFHVDMAAAQPYELPSAGSLSC